MESTSGGGARRRERVVGRAAAVIVAIVVGRRRWRVVVVVEFVIVVAGRREARVERRGCGERWHLWVSPAAAHCEQGGARWAGRRVKTAHVSSLAEGVEQRVDAARHRGGEEALQVRERACRDDVVHTDLVA